jgi:hypothetical protein
MLIRAAFITNSSSTSFIAYGVCFPTSHPVDPETEDYLRDGDDDEIDWENVYEEKTGLGWGKAPVEFSSACHTEDAVMYAKGSHHDIDYGYNPISELKIDPAWDSVIEEACKAIGIDPIKPSWFGWHTGMDG